MASSSWAHYRPSATASEPSATTERPRRIQPRQLLSCTKCRERKVKCDRTKPCSACCARGHPRECEFVVGEGNDYSPIQQSYEIRKLRAENQRLKERLQSARLLHSGDDDEDEGSPDRKGSRNASRGPVVRQRRFKTGDRIDNLYFGTPGLANIVSDFASLQVSNQPGGHSLTHTVPKGKDMYAADPPSYPFPVVVGYGTPSALLNLLPDREDLFEYLDSFQRRAQSCSFPHTPDEVTRKEVARFLADAEKNADRYPDMLALLYVTLATGLQMGQYDRGGGEWVQGAVEEATKESDAFLTASMQALRLGSFMNRPTLLGIQTLIMMGPYLTNSGRFLDAWALFGTTIRVAHSIGLHRNPKFLNPVPPLRECTVRQTLWWWMLHMDQQYSVTLGRPLGISGFGDCPPPELLTTDPTVLRLGDFIDHFTILARQILSSDGLTEVAKIDEFTDKLLALWETMPEALQWNETWVRMETQLPEWPLDVMSATLFAKVQSFLILLNRQRLERTQSAGGSLSDSPPGRSSAVPSNSTVHAGPDHGRRQAPMRGRDLVITSSTLLLKVFLFFYYRNPAVMICWTIGQQAFNACMIILLDECETGNQMNRWLVEQAYVVFTELERKGVHKLAELAVQKISAGLVQLGHRRQERDGQASASRQQSQQAEQRHTQLSLDTASMHDWSGDTVMGNIGMFLLEDPGLQSCVSSLQAFQPLAWNMAGSSAHPSTSNTSHPSGPPTPNAPSPTTVSVSQVTAAPFPVMSTSLMPSSVPLANSTFPVGLQPRMPPASHRRPPTGPRQHSQHGYHAPQQPAPLQTAFTPINGVDMNGLPITSPLQSPQQYQQHRHSAPQTPMHQQQPQSFPQVGGTRHGHGHRGSSTVGTVPRSAHRLDKPPRSQQRRN